MTKNHDEYCKNQHLLTTGNCHKSLECEECREIWEAATKASEEKFISTNSDLMRLLCDIKQRVDVEGGFDSNDTCTYDKLALITSKDAKLIL